ncbi:amidohydrolase family protein [Massilia sp.]|uniref:amidohydrolase family protein n=1 Tax=Massilia sp. TaxID=1882437 RepID=UPI00391C767D
MKFKALLAGLLALALVPTAAAEAIWITNVKLVSPERLERIEAGSVLVENGRIAAVHRGPGARMPAGARRVDGKGGYLTPGLIDSHVHLHAVPGMSLEQAQEERALTEAYQRQLPRSFLYYGYTTVVDLAVADMGVIERFRAAPLHPEVVHCGPPLPMANGYPMSFLPEAKRFAAFPNSVYDPARPTSVPPGYRPEEHTPQAGVARAKAAGGVCVKTHFERGFGRERNLPVWSPALFAEVRGAARANRMALVTHANSFEGQRFAVENGADVLAHGMWHWGSLNGSKELPDEIRALLDRIVAAGIGYQPTMRVLVGLDAYFDRGYLRHPGVRKVVPKALADWYATPGGQWFGEELAEGHSHEEMLEAGQAPLRRLRQVIAYLAARDANLLFATDTPSSPTYGNLPGLNGFLEMQHLADAGMSPAQVLRAATIGNARAFGLLDRLGSIEPGKDANLLLLRDSPLASVQAWDSIVTLWVGGRQVERARLAAGAR